MKKLVTILSCLLASCATPKASAPPEPVTMAQSTLDSTVKIELPSGGHGSGFFIAPNVLLTAAHVVDGLVDYPTVRTRGGKTCDVQRGEIIVGHDAALLWTKGCGKVPYLGIGPHPKEGAEAWAAGAPLDAEWSITKGIVTDADHRMGYGEAFLVLDLVAHPGMSGGPVVDYAGRVIGITVRIMTPGGYNWGGKTFAVPYGHIRPYVDANL